jgi:hypothetical protein
MRMVHMGIKLSEQASQGFFMKDPICLGSVYATVILSA